MKANLEFEIRNIYLGIKMAEDPKDDKHQSLVIDDFSVEPHSWGYGENKKKAVIINIKKHHIKERSVNYCMDCLKKGKRNRDALHGYTSKKESWHKCVDHFAEYMREKSPENACPNCDKGYLTVCGVEGEDRCCTHCDHRINVRSPFDLSFMINPIYPDSPTKET